MLTATIPNIDGQNAIVASAKRSGKFASLVRDCYRDRVIIETARELGIAPTESELQSAADRFRTANQLESITATCQWLEANLISVEDFQEMINYQLIVDKLSRHLFAERVEHYFHQHAIAYMRAFIYEVILPDWYSAIEIFYALEEGDLTFASVVDRYVSDIELKRRGGYVGAVERDRLRPEIAAAVFAATPPQVIKPVRSDAGVHLLRVEEIVYPQLDEPLRERILKQLFDRWLTERIAEIFPQSSLVR